MSKGSPPTALTHTAARRPETESKERYDAVGLSVSIILSSLPTRTAEGLAGSHLEFEGQLMPFLVKESNSQRQHDGLLAGVTAGGWRALLGVDGVGLCTGVIAGGNLEPWGACLLIPAHRHRSAFTTSTAPVVGLRLIPTRAQITKCTCVCLLHTLQCSAWRHMGAYGPANISADLVLHVQVQLLPQLAADIYDVSLATRKHVLTGIPTRSRQHGCKPGAGNMNANGAQRCETGQDGSTKVV